MPLPDIILSISLISIGGAVVGAGVWRLNRLDRLRVEAARQSGCRWHDWQPLDDGIWLVCGLCGKRSRKLTSPRDATREALPSDHLFP
jgi:hypothetical protein